MKKYIKYLVTTTAIVSLLFSIYKLSGDKVNFWYLIPTIVLFLELLFGEIITDKGKDDEIRMSIWNPKSYKKITHESGVYNIRYYPDKTNDNYILYKDNIIYKKIISSFDDSNYNNSEELLRRIKAKLDSIYSEQMRIKKKKEILNKMEEYTSTELKRDCKIKDII